MDENCKRVIVNIKKFRKAKKVNQEELAEKIGLSRSSIANMERGGQSISLENLLAISEALEINVVRFFDDVESLLQDIEIEYQSLRKNYERLVRSLNKLTNEFNFLDD